jgi:PAS domain S-box-containing protein
MPRPRHCSYVERELIRHFPNGLLILCDHDLRWVIVDGQELTRTGRTPGDMEGRTIHELYPPGVCARIEPFIRRVLAGEEVSYDAELLGKRYFVQGVPVYENGRIAYAALATQDQTQLQERLDRLEAELREATDQFSSAFSSATIGKAIVALDGTWLQVNPALCRMLGYSEEEFLELTFQDVTHWADLDADLTLTRDLLSGEIETYELEKRYLRKDGTVVPALLSVSIVRDADGTPLRFISEIVDRTNEVQRRTLEQELAERRRADALNVMAGGLAHDFNNQLVAILGRATLAYDALDPTSPAFAHVQAIEASARHVAELTDQMLAFTGRAWLALEPLDLGVHARHVVEQLGVDVRWSLAPDLPPVQADAAQLERVTSNLIQNAVEAGGEISIATGTLHLTRAALDRYDVGREANPGLYAYLEVIDSGVGMSEETRSRMFEPFFTTKFVGRGLGLAAVEGLIRAHGGALAVQTLPGAGTTVRVFLPAAA